MMFVEIVTQFFGTRKRILKYSLTFYNKILILAVGFVETYWLEDYKFEISDPYGASVLINA